MGLPIFGGYGKNFIGEDNTCRNCCILNAWAGILANYIVDPFSLSIISVRSFNYYMLGFDHYMHD